MSQVLIPRNRMFDAAWGESPKVSGPAGTLRLAGESLTSDVRNALLNESFTAPFRSHRTGCFG